MGMAVSSYQTELPCHSDRCFPDLIGKCWFPPESCGRWEDMVSTSAVSPLKGCWETLEKRHCKSKTKSVRGTLCESHLLCSPGCSSYSSTIRRSSSRWGKSPFAFSPRRAPHPCWSSSGHVYLSHVNTAGCRSEQLSSWLHWLPLDLLRNESHFCFRTNNHLPELLQYDLLETATALTV